MVAATVNLPDDLYARLERLARERGVTVGELVRQGAETLVRGDHATSAVEEPAAPDDEEWSWPAVHLGPVADVPVEFWRELANETGWIVEKAIAEGRLDELREE